MTEINTEEVPSETNNTGSGLDANASWTLVQRIVVFVVTFLCLALIIALINAKVESSNKKQDDKTYYLERDVRVNSDELARLWTQVYELEEKVAKLTPEPSYQEIQQRSCEEIGRGYDANTDTCLAPLPANSKETPATTIPGQYTPPSNIAPTTTLPPFLENECIASGGVWFDARPDTVYADYCEFGK